MNEKTRMSNHPRKIQRDPHLVRIGERYEALYMEIVEEIEAMTDEEKSSLVAACKELTQVNCSWLLYHAANDLIRMAVPYDLWNAADSGR